MAWTRHGIRRPRRRREDWRPPSPPAARARVVDQIAEPPAADPWLVLNREIDRSRRYAHPLALMRVTVGGPSGPTPPAARLRREGRPSGRDAAPLAKLVATTRAAIRSGDAVWTDGTAAYVLAPETDGAGAAAMARRAQALVSEQLGRPVDVRIAGFPHDGLTGHALRASLAARGRRFRAIRDVPVVALDGPLIPEAD